MGGRLIYCVGNMKGLFKWFSPLEVMNDPEEGHAFLIGFGDGVAFTQTGWSGIENYSTPKEIKQELHYYKLGLFLGRFAIVGFVTGMIALLKGC